MSWFVAPLLCRQRGGHGCGRLPAIADERVHETHHSARLSYPSFEIETRPVQLCERVGVGVERQLGKNTCRRGVTSRNGGALKSVRIAVYVPGDEKIDGGELQHVILRGQKLSVGVAHVRRHVGANSERVRAHLLRVPHDVLVRLLVRVQRQAQDGILPRDRRLKALSLVRHARALALPRVFGFPRRRRRLELVTQHNAEQLHAHHHLVGIGKVQRRRRRRARRA